MHRSFDEYPTIHGSKKVGALDRSKMDDRGGIAYSDHLRSSLGFFHSVSQHGDCRSESGIRGYVMLCHIAGGVGSFSLILFLQICSISNTLGIPEIYITSGTYL